MTTAQQKHLDARLAEWLDRELGPSFTSWETRVWEVGGGLHVIHGGEGCWWSETGYSDADLTTTEVRELVRTCQRNERKQAAIEAEREAYESARRSAA